MSNPIPVCEIVVETPCDLKTIEDAIVKISHAGGCMNCCVNTCNGKIVFQYMEHN